MSTKVCDAQTLTLSSTKTSSALTDLQKHVDNNNSGMMPMAQMSSLASSMMQSIAQQLQQTSMHPQTNSIESLAGTTTNQSQMTDPNEPNPEILLALIARNKALEGKSMRYVSNVATYISQTKIRLVGI